MPEEDKIVKVLPSARYVANIDISDDQWVAYLLV